MHKFLFENHVCEVIYILSQLEKNTALGLLTLLTLCSVLATKKSVLTMNIVQVQSFLDNNVTQGLRLISCI
jgi:hypothetical protein